MFLGFSKRKNSIKKLVIASFVLPAIFCTSSSARAFDHSHRQFTNELQKYVGLDSVDYQSWRKSPASLKRYIDSLTAIKSNEYKTFSTNEKKALWLNAYNAMTIYLVLKNYPVKGNKKYYPSDSIRQIDGFWEDNKITIAKRTATLAQIEHNVLRRDFNDPRTHFAVVPAARGGATIDRVAFRPYGLNVWLDRKTKEYLGDLRNVHVDTKTKTVYVTQLFRWFPIDFAKSVKLEKKFPPPTDDEIIVTYLKKFGPRALVRKLNTLESKDLRVIYEPFDWALNDLETVKLKQFF